MIKIKEVTAADAEEWFGTLDNERKNDIINEAPARIEVDDDKDFFPWLAEEYFGPISSFKGI